MNEIIIAIIITIFLLLILSLLFFFTTKRVNILLKKAYVDKLQEFDFLLEEKEKKIDELNKEIEENKKQKSSLENEIQNLYDKKKNITIIEKNVSIPVHRDFDDDNDSDIYKKIKSSFKINQEDIIKTFIRENVKEENSYELYSNIRNKLTHKIVYKISTYDEATQKDILREILEPEEYEIIKKNMNKKKFNIIKLSNELENLISLENPSIYIYVGNKNENYDKLHKNIQTKYDENIIEGIRIEYKGKIYDYSI